MEILTPVGEVQNHVNLSTYVTVQDKTLQGGIKNSIPTCRKQVR